MALFYTGRHRPVLKGRSAEDNVNPYTGEEEVYSNWSIFNTSHVLDGAPNTDHTPGDGRHPHGLQMTRMYLGLETHSTMIEELREAGGGVRIDGMRYRPLENKAAGNNLAFKSDYGHAILTPEERRDSSFALIDPFDDTFRQTRLDDPGHIVRGIDDAGTANSFGTSYMFIYKGITDEPLDDTYQTYPTDYDHDYGKNRTLEWRGVTSAKALNV